MEQDTKTNQNAKLFYKTCKHCGKEFFMEYRCRNVKRHYCSKSCATAVRNSETKTKGFEDYKSKLPEYLEADWTQYKNTRSKITFYDKEYDESFICNIFNVLYNGMKGKKRNAAILRANTIRDLQAKLPQNILLIEETYLTYKTPCSFKNTDTGEIFKCQPQRIVKKLEQGKCLKKKENKLRDLEIYKTTLPSFLVLHDETYSSQQKKAKFTDSEYNVEYWGRARVPNKYGVAVCAERKRKEFRERSCLTQEQVKMRLFKVYGDEIEIDWSSYKSCNEIALFKSKDGHIMKYTVNDAFMGHLRGARGKIIAWTQFIKERDKMCLITSETEKLHAHHVYSKKSFPKYQFDINNGIALCERIHKEFHSTYGIKNNTKSQLLEFALLKGINLSEKLKDCPDIP